MHRLINRPRTHDEGLEPDRRPPGGPPRWASGAIIALGIVALVLVVVLHLTGTLGPGAH